MFNIFCTGHKDQINFAKVCRTIRNFIREQLVEMPSKSRHDFLIRNDEQLIVREADWEKLGELFYTRLNNLTSEDKRIFPRDVQFKFVFYKFGKFLNLMMQKVKPILT